MHCGLLGDVTLLFCCRIVTPWIRSNTKCRWCWDFSLLAWYGTCCGVTSEKIILIFGWLCTMSFCFGCLTRGEVSSLHQFMTSGLCPKLLASLSLQIHTHQLLLLSKLCTGASVIPKLNPHKETVLAPVGHSCIFWVFITTEHLSSKLFYNVSKGSFRCNILALNVLLCKTILSALLWK